METEYGLGATVGPVPLLVVSSSVVNAISLGLATALVMALSGASIAPIRSCVSGTKSASRSSSCIAVLVTVIQYLMNAYTYAAVYCIGISSR